MNNNFNLESMKWNKVELDGPPPACRLDFATCTFTLKVLTSSQDAQEVVAEEAQRAKDVLDQHIRQGSAGSVRSAGSAGSQRSLPEESNKSGMNLLPWASLFKNCKTHVFRVCRLFNL